MTVEKVVRISPFYRERIEALSGQGISPLNIRKRLIQEHEISITTRAIKLHLQRRKSELESGTRKTTRKRPEKKKLTAEHLAFIDRAMDIDDETTAPELQKKIFHTYGLNVSISTIKRGRRWLGWTKTQARYCQLVRDVNKEKRKMYCSEVWRNQEHFHDVIFTDECTVRMQSTVRLSFRRHGRHRRLKGIPKHPYSVHVWGGISRRGATGIYVFTDRMNSEGYQEILRTRLLPFISKAYPEGHRLYQDNDPKHTSKSTRQWFSDNGVNLMPAPPESPDLNPIEMVWASLKYHLRRNVKPRTKDELIDGIHQFWDDITPETCQKYINHLYKVVPAVILARGAASGY